MNATTVCITCELGLHHCHAPIVEHDDGSYECVAGCGGPRAIHDEVVPALGLVGVAA